MRVPFARFAAAAFFTAAIALSASPAASADNKVSPAVGKPLSEAQKALKANDFATALTQVQAAQAASNRTPFDDYMINQFLGNIYIGQKDYKSAETAFKAMADSPAIPEGDKWNVTKGTVQLAINVQDWPTAVAYGDRLQASGQLTDDVAEAVAIANYNAGNLEKANQIAVQTRDSLTKQGKPVPQAIMDIVTRVEMKNNPAAAAKSMETMAQTYGDPNVWADVIQNGLQTKGMHEAEALHLYRLRLLTNATTRVDDYEIMAIVSNDQHYPVETVAILERGQAQGVVSPSDKAGKLLSAARVAAAKDKSSIGEFENLAKNRKTGDYDLKLAETYYGYGRYGDAADAASRALTKGGLKDRNEAQMVLGEALAAQGKNAEATAAFNQVAGGVWPQIAHLWLLYTQRQYTTAATH
jgi:tetratricopeptide (TPR) repeat protein